jgi:hypothetical protein
LYKQKQSYTDGAMKDNGHQSKVRGIRFTKSEDDLIESFLQKNPFFDFSTIARIAITEFIRNPKLNFVNIPHAKKPDGGRNVASK